jgi:fused signal recognition particle receptor
MASPSGLWGKLRAGLARTQERLSERLGGALDQPARLDDAVAAELEEALIGADLGVATTATLIERLRERLRRGERPAGGLRGLLADEIARLLDECPEAPKERWPRITLVVGVNGAGKTTSIAKLAKRDLAAGRGVLLCAGDTFRAAAAEQLALWGERLGIDVVRQAAGTDPAAVVFDAVQRARARGIDHLIVDTAGRLHNKEQLMAELAKVHRVLEREAHGWSVRTLLVLDATTGQNGLVQAEQFTEAVEVTGVVLTKLDGSAKGGIVFAIQQKLGIPVKLVGLGESAEDLVPFDVDEFVDALFA